MKIVFGLPTEGLSSKLAIPTNSNYYGYLALFCKGHTQKFIFKTPRNKWRLTNKIEDSFFTVATAIHVADSIKDIYNEKLKEKLEQGICYIFPIEDITKTYWQLSKETRYFGNVTQQNYKSCLFHSYGLYQPDQSYLAQGKYVTEEELFETTLSFLKEQIELDRQRLILAKEQYQKSFYKKERMVLYSFNLRSLPEGEERDMLRIAWDSQITDMNVKVIKNKDEVETIEMLLKDKEKLLIRLYPNSLDFIKENDDVATRGMGTT